jgi:demethylmenaquinone methyltransferase/2-methoxy-6-polyprenyl-1,4-benzoquinol methylase
MVRDELRARFRYHLRDFDLSAPASKLDYTRKVFSVVAVRYDVITRLLSFGRDGRWKQILLSRLPKDPANSVSCLDLACGTGDISRLLALQYPRGMVDAIDLNTDMLRRARARTGLSNIRFHQMNMNDLAFDDESYDIVTGGYALRNSPHLATTFREIYRVLKPGGTAAFLEFSTSHDPLIRGVQLRLLGAWGGFWGWVFHRNPEVYSYIARSLSYYPDFVELPRMMMGIGFRKVHQKRLLLGMLALTFAGKAGMT